MRCVQKVFWKDREIDKKSKEAKEPLIAEETEYKEDKYALWGAHKKAVLKGKMEPLQVHTFNTLSSPLRTVNSPEYNRIEIEYSPATRINNYLNSLSQDQCTNLINQFGKMLEEL